MQRIPYLQPVHDRAYFTYEPTLVGEDRVQDVGLETPDEEHPKPRRRTAIACTRCRKRKIRCSGDPGDGSGCNACRAAKKDPGQCMFHRVGAQSLEVLARHIDSPRQPSISTSASFDYGNSRPQIMHHRSSLPNLPLSPLQPSRQSLPVQATPMDREQARQSFDAPTRHGSFAYYHDDMARFYGTSAFRYGQLPQTSPSRGSVNVTENPLNLHGLQESLPASRRRLPVPPSLLKQGQPASSLSWRPQGGIHDKVSMSWAPEQVTQPEPDQSTVAAPSGGHDASRIPQFGYQFSQPAQSPDISPTTEVGPVKLFDHATLKPMQIVDSTNSTPTSLLRSRLSSQQIPPVSSASVCASTVLSTEQEHFVPFYVPNPATKIGSDRVQQLMQSSNTFQPSEAYTVQRQSCYDSSVSGSEPRNAHFNTYRAPYPVPAMSAVHPVPYSSSIPRDSYYLATTNHHAIDLSADEQRRNAGMYEASLSLPDFSAFNPDHGHSFSNAQRPGLPSLESPAHTEQRHVQVAPSQLYDTAQSMQRQGSHDRGRLNAGIANSSNGLRTPLLQ